MTKTDKEYDRLFETLMTYTEFTSVDKIEKTEDLHTFFNDIKHNAQAKGRKNPVSRNLKEEMIKAYGRLLRKPIHHKIHTEKETATTTKPHKRFQTAKEQKLTFVYNKQEIYKTIIHRGKKHKPITVYRNSNGQFVGNAKPKISYQKVPVYTSKTGTKEYVYYDKKGHLKVGKR